MSLIPHENQNTSSGKTPQNQYFPFPGFKSRCASGTIPPRLTLRQATIESKRRNGKLPSQKMSGNLHRRCGSGSIPAKLRVVSWLTSSGECHGTEKNHHRHRSGTG
ncbi:hypothetical protein [Leisingera sp. MMG026]|uniref:hypothetical protein n=1 Tax=Leisingera sp. MMG026 TaxID=2909982 RepID=UPI001F1EA825|nr:hypothetical protein [Leisingera sp. MMG026]MCF6429750.1 hypothetical protein [Leisingera sp. MMG026]